MAVCGVYNVGCRYNAGIYTWYNIYIYIYILGVCSTVLKYIFWGCYLTEYDRNSQVWYPDASEFRPYFRYSSAGSIGTFLASESPHFSNASFYYFLVRFFPFSFLFRRKAFFSRPGFVFFTFLMCASTRCRRAPIPQAQNNKAQQSTPQRKQPCTKQRSKNVLIRAR